jgi:hypothetical protein
VVKEADKEEANEEDKQLKKGKTLCWRLRLIS